MERKLLANLEKLIHFIDSLQSNDQCIIDEIQQVPELIPVVHFLIE